MDTDILSGLADQALAELSPKQRLIGSGQLAGEGPHCCPAHATRCPSWGGLADPQLHLLVHLSVNSLFSEQLLWDTFVCQVRCQAWALPENGL